MADDTANVSKSTVDPEVTSQSATAVVGGGAAGLALAARLSEDPSMSVVVLGAGVNGTKIEYDALEALGATGWNWDTMFAASKKVIHLPVANRSNLRVLTESQVSRIIWSAEKTNKGLLNATGVEFLALDDSIDGSPRKMFLKASNIILSAGALNTPKLLELSGVGDADILRRVGIDVEIDLPGIQLMTSSKLEPLSTASYALKNGSVDVLNLIRSAILVFQPFSALFNASDLARSREILSVKPPNISIKQFDIMKTMIEETDVPQVEFAWNIAADQNNVTSLVFDRLILLKPLSRGFVHVNSTNPLDPPVINPRYATHDKFALAKAVQYTRTLVNTEPLKALVEGPLIPDQNVQTDEDFVNFVDEQSVSE
ncbi:hypothetical protein C0992_004793 [Termitomyces sp. T32_za158]|nr:hypothetical protein C0992_004793 [Termitomyces sp. T32_za158]